MYLLSIPNSPESMSGCRQQNLKVYFLNDDVFRRKSSAEALQALVRPETLEGIA
jgi:hypothetical protein